MTEHDRVLVTGGSGFVGGHVILRLLADGYQVRTTVRSTRREADVHAGLRQAGVGSDALEFAVADLTADAGWAAAVEGCDAVMHVASPFPARQPVDENDVITPAREGTLRVLRASVETGVRRIVMTSSFAAIGYSPKPAGAPYDETDWTDPSAPNSPYVKSKTLAERDAWDFAAANDIELTVINPVGIFGPLLGAGVSTSVRIVDALLNGTPPVLPRASFSVVDVRDVAALHVMALSNSDAVDHRFLAAAGQPVTLPEIAGTLRARLGPAARRVPRHTAPDWLVRTGARVVPALRELANLLGEPKRIDATKATEVLGWQPRSTAETLEDTARSLLDADLAPAG